MPKPAKRNLAYLKYPCGPSEAGATSSVQLGPQEWHFQSLFVNGMGKLTGFPHTSVKGRETHGFPGQVDFRHV